MVHPRITLLLLLPWLLGAETELRVVAHGSTALARPGVAARWLGQQLARANRHFSAAGIVFRLEHRTGDEIPVEVRSREERHRLAAWAPRDGDLHLFLVQRLGNIDAVGDICGVHWRYRGAAPAFRGRRYLILSLGDALPDTLAHELGHYFGLSHRRAPGNLMTSPGRAEKSELATSQIQRVKVKLGAALGARELVERR